jgi:hypothetical protein
MGLDDDARQSAVARPHKPATPPRAPAGLQQRLAPARVAFIQGLQRVNAVSAEVADVLAQLVMRVTRSCIA